MPISIYRHIQDIYTYIYIYICTYMYMFLVVALWHLKGIRAHKTLKLFSRQPLWCSDLQQLVRPLSPPGSNKNLDHGTLSKDHTKVPRRTA